MRDELLRLESVLFAYGRLVDESEIKGILKTDVSSLLKELKSEYEKKKTSLNLVQQGSKWKLTVKDDYLSLVRGIVTKTELDRQTMETLAVIAFRYPVLQSDVIKLRNASAYDHIKTLSEAGYIIKEKHGRSYKLKLTQKFFDYFDLPEEKLKEFFSDFEDVAKDIEDQEKEAETLRAELKKQEEIEKKQKENKQLNAQPTNPEPDTDSEPPLPLPGDVLEQ